MKQSITLPRLNTSMQPHTPSQPPIVPPPRRPRLPDPLAVIQVAFRSLALCVGLSFLCLFISWSTFLNYGNAFVYVAIGLAVILDLSELVILYNKSHMISRLSDFALSLLELGTIGLFALGFCMQILRVAGSEKTRSNASLNEQRAAAGLAEMPVGLDSAALFFGFFYGGLHSFFMVMHCMLGCRTSRKNARIAEQQKQADLEAQSQPRYHESQQVLTPLQASHIVKGK